MKKLLALCGSLLALGVASPLAQAQSRGPDTAPSAAQQIVEEIGLDRLPTGTSAQSPTNARNLSVLQQTGANNEATIEQISLGSLPNQALIVQVGMGNVVGLYQSGFDNTASVKLNNNYNKATVDQRGSNNSFDGQVTGSYNTLQVVQDGVNNHSTLDVTGDGRLYPVSQIGNDNSLVQREGATSTAPQGYGVEMRGNGIRLTIEQGHVQP